MAQEEAQHEQVRRWDGDVAGTGELDEVRAWVVWGEGRADDRAAEPERAEDLPGEPGNDIARQIAATNDPDWKPDASTSWIRVVEGDEQDVDGFVQDDESARGYAPYLMAPEEQQILLKVAEILKRLQFGTILLVVQDGKVVQIEMAEKFRLR